MADDREKLNKIESLKSKLFSRDYETKIEYRDTFSPESTKPVAEYWPGSKGYIKSNDNFFMKTSMFKKFFVFSIIVFLLSLVYVFYNFYSGGNTVSNENIDIAVLGNTFTNGGDDLPLQIEITNKNNTALNLVDLVVEYPKGSSSELSQETERQRSSLGSIEAGAVRTENIKVVLFGEQGSKHQIKISMEYRVEGSNAIFVKEKNYEVTINSTPVNLLVDGPVEISPNEDVVLNVKIMLNAGKPISGMAIKLDYPVGFQFVSSKTTPSFGNNVWDLGDLTPGNEKDIEIVGRMIDVFDGEEKTFHVYGGLKAESDKSVIGVVFNSLAHTIAIKKPFIEAKFFVGGEYKREYASSSKSPIKGSVQWKNNLDTKINDLVVSVKLHGSAFNRMSVSSVDGFYKSLEDSLIWDKNTNDKFAEVKPGESGVVSFSVSPLPLFSTDFGLLSDPSIEVDVSIVGKQALEGNITKELRNSDAKTIKIISDIGLANNITYYSGPFQNTGPIPPKADQETTYTITWTLSNTSNNLSKTQVRSTLPPWSRFTGLVSPSKEDVSYNSSTKEIIWNVGNVSKGTGITGNEKEVSFQVALLPSISQIGESPAVINESVLTGHDDFANVDVRANRSAQSTKLTNDQGFPSNGGRVIE